MVILYYRALPERQVLGWDARARNYADAHSRRLHALTTITSSAVRLFAFAFVGFIAHAIVSAVLQVSASFRF